MPCKRDSPGNSGNRVGKPVIESKVSGCVVWFSMRKGYGFISRYDTKQELFFHHRSILRGIPSVMPNVEDGDEVTFDIAVGEKGKEAINIVDIDGNPVKGVYYRIQRGRGARFLHFKANRDENPATAAPEGRKEAGEAKNGRNNDSEDEPEENNEQDNDGGGWNHVRRHTSRHYRQRAGSRGRPDGESQWDERPPGRSNDNGKWPKAGANPRSSQGGDRGASRRHYGTRVFSRRAPMGEAVTTAHGQNKKNGYQSEGKFQK